MTDERQKKTTEEYRTNWDNIFKQAKVLKENIKVVNEVFEEEYQKHKQEDKK